LNLMRIRILLFIFMRVLILLFNLSHIRIRFSKCCGSGTRNQDRLLLISAADLSIVATLGTRLIFYFTMHECFLLDAEWPVMFRSVPFTQL
jgi:hypothetical protein